MLRAEPSLVSSLRENAEFLHKAVSGIPGVKVRKRLTPFSCGGVLHRYQDFHMKWLFRCLTGSWEGGSRVGGRVGGGIDHFSSM